MSTYLPLRLAAGAIDLSERVVVNSTVVASPTDNTETIIGSITLPPALEIVQGVAVLGWMSCTIGTSGASFDLKIRQTNVSGSTIAASGALTTTAADLVSGSIIAWDTAPADNQVYKFTLTVASAAAASTVSALGLVLIAV